MSEYLCCSFIHKILLDKYNKLCKNKALSLYSFKRLFCGSLFRGAYIRGGELIFGRNFVPLESTIHDTESMSSGQFLAVFLRENL